MAIDQGNGATFTFATSAFTANITEMSADGETREDIDTSHLGTTLYRTFVPGDLSDGGTYTLTIQFDPEDLADIPRKGANETMTLTYAISDSGNTTNGTVEFDGYVNSVSNTVEVNALMMADLVIKVAGTPTFTNETT